MASRQAKPSRTSDVPLALDRVAALAMTASMSRNSSYVDQTLAWRI